MPVHPQISGPARWSAGSGPPTFAVDCAGMPFYMIEMAGAPSLMVSIVDRSRDNYFFGGDVEGVLGTGSVWTVPRAVWERLSAEKILYYRVLVVDQVAGRSALSVDDQHLDDLPKLIVLALPKQRGCPERVESSWR